MRLWKSPHTGLSHDADVSFCLMSWCLSWRSWCAAALKHVVSSLARKPGSWVRIPLRVWMFDVCVFFCVYVVLCIGWGLATSWSLVQGFLPSVKWLWNWEISPMLQNGSKNRKKNLYCRFLFEMLMVAQRFVEAEIWLLSHKNQPFAHVLSQLNLARIFRTPFL
jgi:hypothetical protein